MQFGAGRTTTSLCPYLDELAGNQRGKSKNKNKVNIQQKDDQTRFRSGAVPVIAR
jgi:hypothetical protein